VKSMKYVIFLLIVVVITGCISMSSGRELTTDEIVYHSAPSSYMVEDISVYIKKAPGLTVTVTEKVVIKEEVFQDAIKRSMGEYGFRDIYGTASGYEQGKYDWILTVEPEITMGNEWQKMTMVTRYSLMEDRTQTTILDKFITSEKEEDFWGAGRGEGVVADALIEVVKENLALFLTAVDELAGTYTAEKTSDEKLIITVMDFRTENISDSEAFMIEDLMGSALVSLKKFMIIERAQREKMLEEIEYSYEDCTDEQCQIEIGRMIAADNIVIGSLGRVGERYILNVKLIKVETGEAISSSYQAYKSIEELIDGCTEIAEKLAGLLD